MKIKNKTKLGYIEAEVGDGIDISSRMESHRGTVQKGLIQTLTCQCGNDVGVVVENESLSLSLSDLRIRKLTPYETGRLMGFEDKDTKAIYDCNLPDSALYHCHGDSIVVTVQMAIFSNLFFGNDIHNKTIQNYVDSIVKKEQK